MILTGKCKEDFEKWILSMVNDTRFHRLIKISNQQHVFVSYIETPKCFLNTLIIEWLDSVGIYIEVKKSHSIYWIYDITIEDNRLPISALIHMQESRQEATEQSIIKANEIYNEPSNKTPK